MTVPVCLQPKTQNIYPSVQLHIDEEDSKQSCTTVDLKSDDYGEILQEPQAQKGNCHVNKHLKDLV